MTPEQTRHNRRLGWILAGVALAFFLGVMVKLTLLGR